MPQAAGCGTAALLPHSPDAPKAQTHVRPATQTPSPRAGPSTATHRPASHGVSGVVAVHVGPRHKVHHHACAWTTPHSNAPHVAAARPARQGCCVRARCDILRALHGQLGRPSSCGTGGQVCRWPLGGWTPGQPQRSGCEADATDGAQQLRRGEHSSHRMRAATWRDGCLGVTHEGPPASGLCARCCSAGQSGWHDHVTPCALNTSRRTHVPTKANLHCRDAIDVG